MHSGYSRTPRRPSQSFSHARTSVSVSSKNRRSLQTDSSAQPFDPSIVVPSATYIERGSRWMEKEEVLSLRDALDTMDIRDLEKAEEEARIQAAAQQEASELVFAHQNPEAVRLRKEEEERIRMTGYRYRDHLRKGSYAHARAASAGPEYFGEDAIIVDLGPARSQSRTSMRSEDGNRESVDEGRGRERQKNYGSLAGAVSAATSRKWSMRRRSSSNRNISGEVGKVFSPDQIWEEPESNEASPERNKKTAAKDEVAVLSPLKSKTKNPLNRVQFAPSSENNSTSPEKVPITPSKPLSRTEIYKNPPSQSRNPAYTSTPPGRSPSPEKVPEVRSEELIKATSKKRDEYSEKLPMPVAVSDKPGRPIVSFDKAWQPTAAAEPKTKEVKADVPPVTRPDDGRRVFAESKLDTEPGKGRFVLKGRRGKGEESVEERDALRDTNEGERLCAVEARGTGDAQGEGGHGREERQKEKRERYSEDAGCNTTEKLEQKTPGVGDVGVIGKWTLQSKGNKSKFIVERDGDTKPVPGAPYRTDAAPAFTETVSMPPPPLPTKTIVPAATERPASPTKGSLLSRLRSPFLRNNSTEHSRPLGPRPSLDRKTSIPRAVVKPPEPIVVEPRTSIEKPASLKEESQDKPILPVDPVEPSHKTSREISRQNSVEKSSKPLPEPPASVENAPETAPQIKAAPKLAKPASKESLHTSEPRVSSDKPRTSVDEALKQDNVQLPPTRPFVEEARPAKIRPPFMKPPSTHSSDSSPERPSLEKKTTISSRSPFTRPLDPRSSLPSQVTSNLASSGSVRRSPFDRPAGARNSVGTVVPTPRAAEPAERPATPKARLPWMRASAAETSTWTSPQLKSPDVTNTVSSNKQAEPSRPLPKSPFHRRTESIDSATPRKVSEELKAANRGRAATMRTPMTTSSVLAPPTVSLSEARPPVDPSMEAPMPPPPAIAFQAPPSISVEAAPMPSISVSETPAISISEAPAISVSAPPAISVSEAPSISVSGPSLISVSEAPSISVSAAPSISISEPATSSTRPLPQPISGRPLPTPSGATRSLPSPSIPVSNNRPLPDPKKATRAFNRPAKPTSPSHWSPAGARATAMCHACALPIEGKVIALAGLTERWHPHCMACYVCRQALADFEISPEPPAERAARLARIEARRRGEKVDMPAHNVLLEDGDEKLRFFCHLDWHEAFAPRCKHCKTPILGEHVVALGGQHFHYGHFFCAECGDPFKQGESHVEADGYAWCVGCMAKRTERRAPRCGLCRKNVIGEVVQALGKEFHADCFRCGDCGEPFETGEIFLRDDVGVSCKGCMERWLKK